MHNNGAAFHRSAVFFQHAHYMVLYHDKGEMSSFYDIFAGWDPPALGGGCHGSYVALRWGYILSSDFTSLIFCIAKSRFCFEWAAEIWVLILACPSGTTGYEKPIT